MYNLIKHSTCFYRRKKETSICSSCNLLEVIILEISVFYLKFMFSLLFFSHHINAHKTESKIATRDPTKQQQPGNNNRLRE